MASRPIRSALVSVFYKDGLEPILRQLDDMDVTLYSTGGTQSFIESLGISVIPVEDLTDYPSILDGRVKTLHPKIFGGILARREDDHLSQLATYQIPEIDLVIVDLYPFEETVRKTSDHSAIIEKIDIGGISLIRAAAKNYQDVVIIPCREEYDECLRILKEKKGRTDLEDRQYFASRAFQVSAAYDSAISHYFQRQQPKGVYSVHASPAKALRYGENPHQRGTFYGHLEEAVHQLHGKELSYNNLVDVDAALTLISEFESSDPTFVVIKHTNACGVATRPTLVNAWQHALAGDPVSAFGGILAANREIDAETARAIDEIFYEVLLAPSFSREALDILQAKKNRILLQFPAFYHPVEQVRSLLNGLLVQDFDNRREQPADLQTVTRVAPTDQQITDLLFANICVKHLKSNTIVLVRDKQLLGMGCGQTSRVDALKQAITKATAFGFDLEGAVMASDAFFPFPDCVEIADQAGITAVIQPGGSVKDKDSIAYCDDHQMAMVFTGNRHFKH